MGLTSPALSYLLAALAAGLLVTIVVCWRRLADFTVAAILLRVASLLTLQAVVLALIFVTVNRTGGYYSSWSDLFGLDRASAAVTASSPRLGPGSARVRPPAKPVTVTTTVPVRVAGDAAAKGILQSVRFSGRLSGLTVAGYIFLPAGYRAGRRGQRYPVIVAISGELASRNSPYGAMRLAQNTARLIALRQLPPVVMVMLPATLPGRDESCLDVPAAAPYANGAVSRPVLGTTFYAEDLPATLERDYQASADPASWALLGDHSGGYCALQLALTRSWVFPTAVVPDGGYTVPPGSANTGGSPELAQQDNLQWVLQNQPVQPVSLLFTSSGPVPGAGAAQPFVRLARHPMRVATAALGGGSWPLSYVLTWIGDAIGSPAAAGVAR